MFIADKRYFYFIVLALSMIIDFKTLRLSAGDILFAFLSDKKSGPIFMLGYVGIVFDYFHLGKQGAVILLRLTATNTLVFPVPRPLFLAPPKYASSMTATPDRM